MIRIGIIGRIGSGKSYVSKRLGFPVFDADLEVNKIYKKNKKCFKKLNKILPNYIISYPIKKEEILKAILSNNRNSKKIGKVIHPEVNLRMNKFIKNNKKKKFIILDVPLLIENKINKKKDILVFIDAKKKEINKRLKKRIGYNKKIIRILKKLQLPVEFKRKKSQFIIKNNFKTNSIKKNVKMILKKINI